MKARRAELIAHCGGLPNAVQRQLIERCVRLMLRLELLDEKLTHRDEFTVHDNNFYLAWSNALTRTIARLGLRGVEAKSPSLHEVIARIEAGKNSGPVEGGD